MKHGATGSKFVAYAGVFDVVAVEICQIGFAGEEFMSYLCVVERGGPVRCCP